MIKSYFTIKKGSDSQFYFNLKAENHEIILQSEGYKEMSGVLNGIKSVQENSSIKSRFEIRNSVKDEPYFVLKAGNGEIIGTSEMYSSKQAMENGLESVFLNGETIKLKNEIDDSLLFICDIIVNGRVKEWRKEQISFEELAELAFGNYDNNPNKCYTITYSNGIRIKPKGSLVKGQEVNVKPKIIFNVSATDKS